MAKYLFMLFLVSSLVAAEEPAVPVSFVRILVVPEKFDNVIVRVFGFYAFTGSIYLTEDHASNVDLTMSIKILPSSEEENNLLLTCANSYAFVEGRLRIDKDGFVSMQKVNGVYCRKSEKIMRIRSMGSD
jgi:hypothetical protein